MTVAARQESWRLVTPDGDPAIDLQPLQGLWTEAQYLRLTGGRRRLLEFTDGTLEILSMPTDRHQVIVRHLLLTLFPKAAAHGGTVLFAPMCVRIRAGKFREPDLVVLRDPGDPRRGNDFWTGADLVVEVVGPDEPDRDLRHKRADYAEARIPEYWIVNPIDETVTVLVLAEDSYVDHGVFRRGQQARSVCLRDCSLDVTSVFEAH